MDSPLIVESFYNILCDPSIISIVYPSISPTIPMIIPTFSMSFCCIMPVACANALGGVLMGNIIASDEPIATPISNVSTPPNADRFSRMLLPAMARIGTSSAAVAVCEMKFAIV